VSASTDRINAVVPRVLPIAVGVVVVAIGYYVLLQPAITAFLRSRAEAETLEVRARALEEEVVRGRGLPWPDEAQAITMFEERVSKEDRVADVAERLTRAVAESAIDGQLRNLAMGTGDQPDAGATGRALAAAAGEAESIDPRWGLFPFSLTHTSLTLSFDASYATIVTFFSKLHDLPSAIEIRSVKLTRGMPLMSAQLTIFVFRRGDMIGGQSPLGPSQPGASVLPSTAIEQPSANPLTPRVVGPRGPGG
jgi:hypothetical protein